MQRSALCRSRRELSNAYFLAKFGFDTAENEPFQVCPLSAYRSPRFAIALNVIYDEVAFRPEHSGAKRAREEFEALTHKHDTKRRCVESNEL